MMRLNSLSSSKVASNRNYPHTRQTSRSLPQLLVELIEPWWWVRAIRYYFFLLASLSVLAGNLPSMTYRLMSAVFIICSPAPTWTGETCGSPP